MKVNMNTKPVRLLSVLLFYLFTFLPLNAQLARYSQNFTLNKTDFADSIAIEWDNGQVFLPVTMDGKRYRFLFDTGAAQAVIYDDMPIAGFSAAGQIRSQDATGTTDTVQMVILPPLTLGNLTLTGCQATIHHRPVKGRNIDGIIGFNLINMGMAAKIDVQNGLLILTDRKGFFDKEQGFETRYRLKFHVPYLEVCPFGKYSEWTLFDTGSRRIYTMNRGSFNLCEAKAGATMDSQVEGRSMGRHAISHFGVEPLHEVVFLNFSQLRVCGYTFSDLHTLTTQGESALGAGVLNYGAVIFNPRKKRVRFQPYNQQSGVSVGNKQLDIAFVPEKGMPCVGLVWEQSEPYRLGFRQGDIITKIDDTPIRSFTQFVTYSFIIGREYRFIVKDTRGFPREIRWTRLKKTPPKQDVMSK